MRIKYGFLYKEYNSNNPYWEFVKIAQKILIIIILSIHSQDYLIKYNLVFGINLAYLILQYLRSPYNQASVNNLDRLSSIACTFTIFFALFASNMPKKEYDYLKYSSFLIIVILNAFFLHRILKLIMSSYLNKFKQICFAFLVCLKIVKNDRVRINPT